MQLVLRAAVLLLTGVRALPALAGGGPDVEPDEPRFREARAIQYGYLPEGISVSLVWTIEGGKFDRIVLWVDGIEQETIEPGVSGGLRLLGLAAGPHRFELDGRWGERTATLLVHHETLTSPQVAQVILHSPIFHGFEGGPSTGALLISWDLPQPPDPEPYTEFEVRIDGKLQHVVEAGGDRDNAVTVRGIREGWHVVGVTALTAAHASREASARLFARGLAAPKRLALTPGPCQARKGAAAVGYEIPAATTYSAVAAWVRGTGGPVASDWVFHGYLPVTRPPEVRLVELPEGEVEIELAGAVFERGADEPTLLSNLPHRGAGAPFGEHAIVEGRIDCGLFRFRRGDVNDDGRSNLADAVQTLGLLFSNGVSVSCPAAADIDDSDQVDITDAIALLGYLFQGQAPPSPPGPRDCGDDPTPDGLGPCFSAACAAARA